MKVRSVYSGAREPGDDQSMTPMIDVVFLLLVFFVCVATDQVVEMSLPTELAGGEISAEVNPPQESWVTELKVKLTRTPAATATRIELNGRVLESVEQLKAALSSLAEISRESPVLLDVDPDVPLEDMIRVYDASRAAQFDRINFVLPRPVVK